MRRLHMLLKIEASIFLLASLSYHRRMRREIEIDGRRIIVVDDILSGTRLTNLAAWLELAPAQRVEGDTGSSDARSWSISFDQDGVVSQPYYDAMMREAGDAFPGETFTLKRAYCNVVGFGDILLPHRDSAAERDVTALLYVAETWERNWGGETIFFDDSGDARHVVSPRPGRLVLFHSIIEHCGTAPSRLCTRARMTLALKLKAAG